LIVICLRFLKILLSAVFLYAPFAHAGFGSGTVKIQHVGGFGAGKLVFFYTSTTASTPACDTNKRWVLDLSGPAASEQYALLLAAQSAGREVNVGGTGVCDIWGDTETVYWVGYPL
jgi:hypothetical protein